MGADVTIKGKINAKVLGFPSISLKLHSQDLHL